MKNLRSFTVTHIGWTNTKPSRVKIHDNRNNVYVYVSCTDTKLDRQEEVAAEYLESIGIKVIAQSQGKKGFLLLTENFETSIKK